MSQDTYISIKEAASLLEVTAATLRNWDKSGKLAAARHPVNQYRMYRLSDVLELQRQSSLFPTAAVDSDLQAAPPAGVPISPANVRRIVRTLHRIMRDGEGNSSLLERFDELTKILFCKIHDEKGAAGDRPTFGIYEGDTDSIIAKRIRDAFASHVKNSPGLVPERFARIRLQDHTIRQIVENLAPVRLSDVGEDLKGLAYEEVIRNTFEKGDNQQFFTPRNVIEFMVSMVGPNLAGRICDPACGTGGFLLFAQSHLREIDRNKSKSTKYEFLGFEIDKRLAWVAGTNLSLHDAKSFNVEHLTGSGSLSADVKQWYEKMDVILTNPPFGSDLNDQKALSEMVLGHGRNSRRRGVLFIERCLDYLKPGGVLGIIIDEGALNGPSNVDVRKLILEKADLFAVVSLPETTFMPYASVKTSILFMQKKGASARNRIHAGKTFYAQADTVGRKPNGEPLFRANASTGRQELDSDLPDILQMWRANLDGPRDDRGYWARLPDLENGDFLGDGLRLDAAYHHPSRIEAMRTLQGSPYPLLSLGEICGLRNEAVVPARSLQEEDILYIGLANIEARSGRCSPVVVSGAGLKSSVKRFVSGDILFAKMRPELRKVCLVSGDFEEGFASSECLVLVPKRGEAAGPYVMLPELIALLLRSDLVYGQIVHQVTGIGRPRLNKSAVMSVHLPVPGLRDQQRLLDLYQRSETAARALVVESMESLKRSEEIMVDARHRLLEDLLANGTTEKR